MKRVLFWAAVALFASLTVVSAGYAVTKTLDGSGAIDFHSYWLAGHFLRLGREPYSEYVSGAALPSAQMGLANVPANTAPLVWLLAGFAFLPWPLAKFAWLAVNMLLAALTPWLVWRLLPEGGARLGWRGKLLLALVFWGIFGTRNIAGNGQTSLLVFALMLTAAGLAGRSWLLAGLLLGVAVSKYSLALPVVLLFAFQRRWRELAAAAGVQVAALLALAAFTHTNVWEIVTAYWQIFNLHTGLEGIHLGSLIPENSWAGAAGAAALTAAVAGWLVVGGQRPQTANRRPPTEERPATDDRRPPASVGSQSAAVGGRPSALVRLHLLTILTLWTLLVAYHRAYDTFTAILFVALAGWGLMAGAWSLSERGRLALWGLLAAGVGVLCLPARGAALLLGEGLGMWLDVQGRGMTLALLALLAVSLWLWGRKSTGESVKP